MKCEKCKIQNGCARCEACHVLFCLPCFTQHHKELSQEFQRLTDHRNQLKQNLHRKQDKSLEENQNSPSIIQIYQWKNETIEQIRRIAAQARNEIQERLQTGLNETSKSLEKISVMMQEKQKDGIVLENDLNEMKNQLDRIQREIEGVPIQINVKISKDVDWKSMIQISTSTTKNSNDSWQSSGNKYLRYSRTDIPDKPRYRRSNETHEDDDIIEDW